MKPATVVKSLFSCIWLLAVGAGYFLLMEYKGTPGDDGRPPQVWPPDSAVALDPRLPTLLMLAHPRCVCTEASLEGLGRFLERRRHQVKPYILFLRPNGVAAGWEEAKLWRQASVLPQVTVNVDQWGREASRFRVTTSGHVLVYHPDGHLLFSGGITPARGHSGDSRGLDRLDEVLEETHDSGPNTAVFGCPLHDFQPQ